MEKDINDIVVSLEVSNEELEKVKQGEIWLIIIGISKDTVESHKKFEEKHGLPFTLLSDTELIAIKAYDVWKEKKSSGKVTMGVVRTTYLIDEKGVIVKAMDKVKAADNPQEMLEEL